MVKILLYLKNTDCQHINTLSLHIFTNKSKNVIVVSTGRLPLMIESLIHCTVTSINLNNICSKITEK